MHEDPRHEGALDWEALNRVDASHGVEVTHGEDGAPLPARVPGLKHHPVDELDEELRFNGE